MTVQTSHVHKFTDGAKVEAMLETFSSREQRNFHRFLRMRDEEVDLFRLSDIFPENDRIGETILRLFKMSQQWGYSARTSISFGKCLNRLLASESIDALETLSVSNQQKIWTKYLWRYSENPLIACADKALLRLLRMTGFPVVAPLGFNGESIRKYVESARKSQRRGDLRNVSTLDLSMPSAEFRINVDQYFKNYGDRLTTRSKKGTHSIVIAPYDTQILVMLRAVYGEGKLWEALGHFTTDDALLCPNEIIDLLENWDELKHYTPDWIKQFQRLEHSAD